MTRKSRHPLKPMVDKVYKKRVDRIQEILKASDSTTQEVANGIGKSRSYMSLFLTRLKNDGMVHITDWVNDSLGRATMPLWAWGKGEDEPRPGRRKQVYQPRKRRDPLAWNKGETSCVSPAIATSAKVARRISTAPQHSTNTGTANSA